MPLSGSALGALLLITAALCVGLAAASVRPVDQVEKSQRRLGPAADGANGDVTELNYFRPALADARHEESDFWRALIDEVAADSQSVEKRRNKIRNYHRFGRSMEELSDFDLGKHILEAGEQGELQKRGRNFHRFGKRGRWFEEKGFGPADSAAV